MKLTYVMAVMALSVFVLLLAACGGGGIPKEAEDYARGLLESEICGNYECKDVKVAATFVDVVSEANKLNGIEGNWCIGFEFVYKDESGTWRDEFRGYYVSKKNGEMMYGGFGYMGKSTWGMFCD